MSGLFVSQPSFPFQVWPDFSAGLVCSSFSAEVCAILHTLRWSRQHQLVCHFSSLLLLSDSRSVLSSIFFLSQSLWQELSSLSCSIKLQWTLVSPGERRGYLRPLQSLMVSLLLSPVSTLIFSWTGGVLFHRNSLTHRFPRFSWRNLCSLVMLTVSSVVYAAADTAFF